MSGAHHGPVDGFIGAIVDAIDERLTARLTELLQARPSQPTADPPYFDQAALAERLRVSARTLEKWRQRGKGPPYRQAGKRVLYPSAGVSKWLEGGNGDSAAAASRKVSKHHVRRVATQDARET
jgi:hypothetical protein